jgi:hypothetical protein
MKRVVSLLLLLCGAALFQRCSWTESFYVINNSTFPAELFITLQPYERGFSIFHYQDFSQYPVNSKSKINIEKGEPVQHDTLDAYYKIRILIPPFKAIRIGQLNNQTYEKYNQAFFNDRTFNLELIRIITENKIIEIPDTLFDANFIKEKGAIKYFITSR